jgi:putative glutamine amidotransferase
VKDDEGDMVSKLPLIGITTYGRDQDNKFTLPAEYVDSVRRAGGIPLLIPPGETHLDEVLAQLDGLLLAGGGDIDPTEYNGQPHPTIYRIDPERDQMELTLARRIVAEQLPTLCICRGLQVLNVALGGTLIEHVPDAVGEAVIHRVRLREDGTPFGQAVRHPVQVDANSQLGQILPQTTFESVSWHHQAAGRVAPGLQVTAQAADGIIEALEMPDHPWLIAVQWHPEMSAAEDTLQQQLFDEFVRIAAQAAAARRQNAAEAV